MLLLPQIQESSLIQQISTLKITNTAIGSKICSISQIQSQILQFQNVLKLLLKNHINACLPKICKNSLKLHSSHSNLYMIHGHFQTFWVLPVLKENHLQVATLKKELISNSTIKILLKSYIPLHQEPKMDVGPLFVLITVILLVHMLIKIMKFQ